jgi:hypothetical protein
MLKIIGEIATYIVAIAALIGLVLTIIRWLWPWTSGYKKTTVVLVGLIALVCLYFVLQPEITFRSLQKPRESALDEATQATFGSKPLGQSTVEIWYEENNESMALEIMKPLESRGAKVSMRVYKEPNRLGMEGYTLYYRDPSNLEAAIEARELLGHKISRYRSSIDLRTPPNADLTVIVHGP